jgi:hypothetical protein
MDKAKTLRVESNPSLDPNGELKSISLKNDSSKFGDGLRQDQPESHQSKGSLVQ